MVVAAAAKTGGKISVQRNPAPETLQVCVTGVPPCGLAEQGPRVSFYRAGWHKRWVGSRVRYPKSSMPFEACAYIATSTTACDASRLALTLVVRTDLCRSWA